MAQRRNRTERKARTERRNRTERKARKARTERKNRTCRKNRRNNMYGGAQIVTPMELTDVSMEGPSRQSIAQGVDFFGYHTKQHGGMAPVGSTGVLDDSLRSYARVLPLDNALSQIAGLRDQSGGKRKKGRKSSRKTQRRRTMRGGSYQIREKKVNGKTKWVIVGASNTEYGMYNSFENAKKAVKEAKNMVSAASALSKMKGGAAVVLEPESTSAPGTLLPPALARVALSTMSPEWKLAENPNSFAPKL